MSDRFQRISPFLWFNEEAEEAASYYVSVFDNSRILASTRYDSESAKAAHRPAGSVMTVAFELDGQHFTALNGGPVFAFTPAISLVVNCRTQEDIDRYWDALSKGGAPAAQQCGWLADRFGVSWQIVPLQLIELLTSGDTAKAQRVMKAVLAMKKLDLNKLEAAAA
ncbi:VOC family protein [Dyella nitratireducens]|uniref:VOC family protein n=1 Tax=Dyella nitratireducens TaxID=1849580 RepID=A0ABQ1GKR5_9GAMM|nr:VOC family protein [Dyella nitratireducens]GGA45181.1 VOC family protein [Dyella nitratireducens]GLQ41286.1 VOC family protein [Dyella nitratireducens]